MVSESDAAFFSDSASPDYIYSENDLSESHWISKSSEIYDEQ